MYFHYLRNLYRPLALVLVAVLIAAAGSSTYVRAETPETGAPETASETTPDAPDTTSESSEDTEDGTTDESDEGAAGDPTAGDGEPSTVDTGNATSGASVVDQDNVNETNTEGGDDTTVTVSNNLVATSSLKSSATSGSNEVSDPDGAEIYSGATHAYGLIASFFNIVLTNSVGKLLLFLNPVDGTLDLSDAFSSVFDDNLEGDAGTCTLAGCPTAPGTDYATYNFLTNSTANLYQQLGVHADSGNNSASSSNSADITTGGADAAGAVINIGNVQIINSRYLMVLFNKFGSLTGDIVLPPAEFFDKLSFMPLVGAGTDISTDNTATVTLNATTSATTGTNTATGTNEAVIGTGDAQTGADVRNNINSSSLGGRPICFIVSVGGTWHGSVVGLPEWFSRESTPFGEVICGEGRPDDVNTRSEIRALAASSTNRVNLLIDALVEANTGGNSASGTRATIKTGDASSFLSVFNMLNQSIIGQDWVFGLFTVSKDWTGDLTFGSKEFWNAVNRQVALAQGGGILRLGPADLTITKEASRTSIEASSTVTYTITIENTGDPVYNALLVDTIYNEDGEAIHEQRWSLDTVYGDETVIITYDAFFEGSTTPGTYTNEAFLSGTDRHPDYENNYGNPVDSPVAEVSIEVTGIEEEAPEVLVCDPLITSYIKRGEVNDREDVSKLQFFLKTEENAGDVAVTGVYDVATEAAVHTFQSKYHADILDPWGVSQSTGYVYYTTQKKVNELWCGRDFPLSEVQIREINGFKNRVQEYEEAGVPVPQDDYREIGMGETNIDSRLAVADDAESFETEAGKEEEGTNNDQLASAAQAGEAAAGILGGLKNTLKSAFGWLGF